MTFFYRYLKGEEFERGLLEKLQQCALEDLQTPAVEANLNPTLEKNALARSIYGTYCMGSDDESGQANYVGPENELLYGHDDKGEASYGRTHDSRRSDLDDDYSAQSANAGGQSKGAGTKVRLPSVSSGNYACIYMSFNFK